ncbi:MAG: 50S ribosomal protein L35 [Trueperaceae bacterium]|jgi:large subunit ribosomal protein L35|nr:50S ribosomal protein L35 [Trueperaceae bacterium]MCC6309836.1 50S ribosomal protein L35 [Trueperaceae bacterium]MCO5172865.1 50S ribosomal protein L35 [Trueperaceae bacterium]MCW5820209.1 50S ribosomal protein L35 [Trueperaceae bacterium]
MPKLKTHKGTKARVKITGRGKVKAMRSGKRHLNYKKSGRKIRQGRNDLVVAKPEAERIKALLPYD